MQRKRPFKRKKNKQDCTHKRWTWEVRPIFGEGTTALGAVRCKDCDEWAWYNVEINWWDAEH